MAVGPGGRTACLRRELPGVLRRAPRVATGVATEAGWLAAHAVMYPLGLRPGPAGEPGRHDLAGLSPEQRSLVPGGLIARYYVQRLGGDAQVHTLVTLGTPHGGTLLARAAPVFPLVRQLRPGSEVTAELAEPAPGCRTRFVAFHSDIDHLIVPHRNARLDHPDLNARNIAVRGVGHLSMPNNGRVAREIVSVLRELDPNGPADPGAT